jgi:periplasmic copper chaperone A
MRRLALFMLLLLAACSPARPVVAQNGIEVFNPQVRVAGSGAEAVAAGYLLVKNTNAEADQLVGASCDFADASLHETKMKGDIMTMNTVDSVEIPAGALLELRSGSYHVMLLNLKRELKTGETVMITLEFKQAGKVSIPARVGR